MLLFLPVTKPEPVYKCWESMGQSAGITPVISPLKHTKLSKTLKLNGKKAAIIPPLKDTREEPLVHSPLPQALQVARAQGGGFVPEAE